MANLTNCLRNSDLNDEDRAYVRSLAREYREDGATPAAAAQSAVNDMVAELYQERAELAKQIEDKGGVVPEKTPTMPYQAAGKPEKPATSAVRRSEQPAEQDEMPKTGTVAAQAGANYTGFLARQARPTDPRRKEPIRRDDILVNYLQALGIPIFEGRVRGKRRMGYFRPDTGTIRIKRHADIETAAHEIAHWIDRENPEIAQTFKQEPYKSELRGVSYDKKKTFEGFAEFVRLWMTQPEKLGSVPNFGRWWDNWLEDKGKASDEGKKFVRAVFEARDAMRAWAGQDPVDQVLSKMGDQSRLTSDILTGQFARFRQAVLDEFQGVFELEKALTGTDTPLTMGPYEHFRLTKASYAVADGALRFGAPVVQPDGSIRYVGKGLEDILEPISRDIDDFKAYAIARSARELFEQGRENLFTAKQINAGLQLNAGRIRKNGKTDFETAFEQYQVWNKKVVDFAVAKGLIGREDRLKWRRSQYIPFYRVSTPGASKRGKGIEGNVSPIKRLTGGTENIRDIFDNMVNNSAMLISESFKNEARLKLVDFARQSNSGKGGQWIEAIPKRSLPTSVDKEQIEMAFFEQMGIPAKVVRAVLKGGLMPADIPDSVIKFVETVHESFASADQYMQFWQHGQAPANKPGDQVIAVKRGGKSEFYEISDPLLFRSVANLNARHKHAIQRFFNTVRRFGQATITLAPDFMGANFVRDTLHAWVFSPSGFKPLWDSGRGLVSRMREDQDYKDFLANGGGMASYLMDEGALQSRLEHFYSRKGVNSHAILSSPRRLLFWMENMTEAFEVATRIGEFKKARAAGVDPRHAAYLSREISTDFARRGDSQIMSFFTDSIMFLNAAMQGMDRAARGLSTDKNARQIWRRSAYLAILSSILYAWNRSNPCYNRLEDWAKDGYWHFYAPKYWFPWLDVDAFDHGEQFDSEECRKKYVHLMLPKIWEIGAMASLAERTTGEVVDQWAGGDAGKVLAGDEIEWWKSFARIMHDQFKLDYVPFVFEPLYELYGNENRFTERPILNQRDESRLPYLQYDDYTSSIAKRLGNMSAQIDPQNKSGVQLSPKVIDHLIRGYTNTFGMYGQMVSNAIDSQKPALRLDQYPVIRRFYQEVSRSKFESEFWKLAKEVQELHNSAKAEAEKNRPEMAMKLDPDRAEAENKEFNRMRREFRDIANEQSDILEDKTLSKVEKRDKIQALRDQRATMAEDFVRSILRERKKIEEQKKAQDKAPG